MKDVSADSGQRLRNVLTLWLLVVGAVATAIVGIVTWNIAVSLGLICGLAAMFVAGAIFNRRRGEDGELICARDVLVFWGPAFAVFFLSAFVYFTTSGTAWVVNGQVVEKWTLALPWQVEKVSMLQDYAVRDDMTTTDGVMVAVVTSGRIRLQSVDAVGVLAFRAQMFNQPSVVAALELDLRHALMRPVSLGFKGKSFGEAKRDAELVAYLAAREVKVVLGELGIEFVEVPTVTVRPVL